MSNNVLGFIVVLALIGIIGGVTMYISEKVADKTALVSGDHYFNASEDVIDSVETGWDFTEIIVLALATGIVLTAIIGSLLATGVLRL